VSPSALAVSSATVARNRDDTPAKLPAQATRYWSHASGSSILIIDPAGVCQHTGRSYSTASPMLVRQECLSRASPLAPPQADHSIQEGQKQAVISTQVKVGVASAGERRGQGSNDAPRRRRIV